MTTPSPLPDVLADALRHLTRHGWTELPSFGATSSLAVRALYRAWLDTAPVWGPLVRLDRGHRVAADALEVALANAHRGILWLPDADDAPEALRIRANEAGVLLLREDPTRTARLPDAWVEGAERVDVFHVVATDPSLVRVRSALAAHVARSELVYVRGPPGSGRASVAGWAHAATGGVRLQEPGRDTVDGDGKLMRDIEERSEAELVALDGRFDDDARRARARAVWRAGRRPVHPALGTIIGHDPALCEVLSATIRHAEGTHPVLILGETGTGKEPLARAVHDASGRRGSFVAFDHAARNRELVEDDLFGHVPGAFQGALRPREGAFRQAHGGTLFLDECGNLTLAAQAKLLGALERGEIQPLGADGPRRVDVRVIAATNADLDAMVETGTFRRDLLYRLRGALLRLPPLRERGEDVVELANHFLARTAGPGVELDGPATALLRNHAWPGNVRELLRVVETAVADADGGPVRAEHIARRLPVAGPFVVTGSVDPGGDALRLSRRRIQQLGALTVTVAAPAERGGACIRNAVFDGLAGRPITTEALALLEAWPWWGNFNELGRKIRALNGAPAGTIDVPTLRRLFPDMATGASAEPIVTLLHPVARDDDELAGLRETHHDAAVLIGRARTTGDLRAAPGDGRGLTRWAWVEKLRGGGSLGFLCFPWIPELSRAHVLVARSAGGLVAHVAPGASLSCVAGPLDAAAHPVVEGEPVRLGAAGEIRILRDDETILQLFVFLGTETLRLHSANVVSRLPGAPRVTVVGARRAWALGPEERRVLIDIIRGFLEVGGEFAPHLRRRLRAALPPGLETLRNYILSTNPTQSCSRLFELPANEALRTELWERLETDGRLERASVELPRNIWASVALPARSARVPRMEQSRM